VKLKELAYGEPLTEGQHVLVAFPSRANHESVKTAGALFVTEFWIGKKGAATTDTSKPMLVYSRPKGDYKGTMAGHVLVDFQLWNAELGEKKHHVLVTVAGPGLDAPLVQKVQELGPPLYLDDARTGDYRIKLELADAEDKPVPGPWNATTREISIDRETLPDLGHSMDVADAGAKKK
jgi:hypothetical protein